MAVGFTSSRVPACSRDRHFLQRGVSGFLATMVGPCSTMCPQLVAAMVGFAALHALSCSRDLHSLQRGASSFAPMVSIPCSVVVSRLAAAMVGFAAVVAGPYSVARPDFAVGTTTVFSMASRQIARSQQCISCSVHPTIPLPAPLPRSTCGRSPQHGSQH